MAYQLGDNPDFAGASATITGSTDGSGVSTSSSIDLGPAVTNAVNSAMATVKSVGASIYPVSPWLAVGGIAALAYFLFFKKKRKR